MSKARILVVEDEKNLLLGLRDILEIDGYEVVTAENGRDALDLLQAGADSPPDLIVSDIMMPHIDGLELLRLVREQERWVQIPFIFLTARGERSDVHLGKFLGADEYIIKPFDADDLLVAVASRLERAKRLKSAADKSVADIKRSILTVLNHEFRTPLTLVVAYAEMLNEFSPDSMNEPELVEFLKGVNSGAQRIRRLVENFITLVELENGDTARLYEMRQQEMEHIRDLLVAASRSVGTDTSTHTIEIDAPDMLPPFVADAELLIIVIRELLSNALKFSDPGTTIWLSASVDGEWLRIAVEDQGRGIPATELDRIWTPFYQIRRDHYEDQGSGAGLAIVSGLIKLHGGWTDVRSEIGVGSLFSVYLPLS
jgi:signal transduction histidine kinase